MPNPNLPKGGGGYQPPGTYTPQTDTGTGGYTPPQNNYAQQQQSAQEAARRRAQQEAARRAELDRLARQNAQQIAEARMRAYQQQMQALQQQATLRSQQEAQRAENEARNRREALDAQAYGQYYGPAKSEEAHNAMWNMGGLNYRAGSLIQSQAMRNYDVLYGPNAPMNRVQNVQRSNDPFGMGMWMPPQETSEVQRQYPWEGVHYDMDQEFQDKKLMSYLDTDYGVPDMPMQANYGGYEYPQYRPPNYGGYGYPSINYNYPEYEEPAKSWYENMLQWNIK